MLDRKQSIYEAQHVTTMIGMVESGLGVAAVPSLAMPAHDHSLLVSVPLEEPVVTRQVGLIRGAEDHCRHRLSSFMIFCSRDQRFPR